TCVEIPDVLPVEIDVDEPIQFAVVGQELGSKAGKLIDERSEHFADGRPADLDLLRTPGRRPENRWDPDRAHAPLPTPAPVASPRSAVSPAPFPLSAPNPPSANGDASANAGMGSG